MPKFILYIAIGLLILFFIGIIYISILKFNKENEKDKFSFLNTCPFEIFDVKRKSPFNIYLSICLIGFLASAILGLIYIIVFYSLNYPNVIGLVIAVSIFAILICVMILLLFTIQLIYIKTFIFTVSFFFAFAFFFLASVGFMLLNTNFTNSNVQLGVAVVELSLASISLIMCLIPALRKFGKMEIVKQDDGTVSVKRPKVILLALFEWIVFLFITIGFIALFLLFILL